MRAISRRFLTVLTSAVLASVAMAPLAAQADAATAVTFAVTGSGLSISTPGTVNIGTSVSGGTLSGQLGAVTVTDGRGALVATWTATVSSSVFVTGGGSTAETIPLAAVSYWSGPATATTGTSVPTPGQLTALLAIPLTTPKTAFSLTAGVSSNSATWNPTLVVAVPAAAVTGNYAGTVTHSVA